MPRCAIITPMYNATGSIGKTIDSVLSQTDSDWEWWLMDDGSTDGTAELAEARLGRDPRVHVVRNGRVGHIGTLRNRAVERTSAPLVAFLDADDCWSPEFLESQITLLTRTQAHVAHGAARHLVNGKAVDVPAKYRGPAVCEPPEMIRHLYPRNPIYSPSVVMQTDVLRSAGGFSEQPDHFSTLDFDLWLRMAPHCRFAYNARPLLFYRVSDQSLSGNPANRLRNFRGEVRSLQAAVARSHDLPHDVRRVLRRLLSRRQSHYARLLLDETPPALALSQKAFREAGRRGGFSAKYWPFYILSLAGQRPPYYLHRILRRLRG